MSIRKDVLNAEVARAHQAVVNLQRQLPVIVGNLGRTVGVALATVAMADSLSLSLVTIINAHRDITQAIDAMAQLELDLDEALEYWDRKVGKREELLGENRAPDDLSSEDESDYDSDSDLDSDLSDGSDGSESPVPGLVGGAFGRGQEDHESDSSRTVSESELESESDFDLDSETSLDEWMSVIDDDDIPSVYVPVPQSNNNKRTADMAGLDEGYKSPLPAPRPKRPIPLLQGWRSPAPGLVLENKGRCF
ncbi:hypothetical protein BDW74DRAFT_179272 [Aspergillus multicolor]|uniref:uncharacterized protein n=1 Tax=Aspergillus multicolor TaxID=41759 RepID=UPI003CCDA739